MTLPASIRVNVKVPFPTSVSGVGFIVVTKQNGRWSIKADYTQLAPILGLLDPTLNEVVVYNTMTKQYGTVTMAQVIASASNNYRTVPAGGTIQVAANDVTLLVTGAPAATNFNLPASSTRNGLPLTIKDLTGGAHANNFTLVPFGTETIDGFNAAAAAANGIAVLDISYGKKTVYPLTSGGWYL